MEKTLSITMDGLVQGVGFRYYIREQANHLGISGLVENLADGSVYIECCGKPNALDKFIKVCQRGPALAKVTTCRVLEIPAQDFSSFKIKY